MRNNVFPFNSTIQRDKFLRMKFKEGNYEKSERGAISFQNKLEAEYPNINQFSKKLDGKQGRNIRDIIMDYYEIKYE